jgi:predicted enzyme related to lactoylglutathione lyase
MEMMKNAINWFEIPVTDFDRAKKFYEAIFDYEMPVMDMGGIKMGILLFDQAGGGVGGSIIAAPEFYKPSTEGTLVYLNGGTDLDVVLGRVEGAGGKVVAPKKLIAEEVGHMGMFHDTEGNRVALHSMG